MENIDLIIRNALVFDGGGGEPEILDVAVHQGSIYEVAKSLKLKANETIDAHGLALMPGIIDSHTHYDAQITWDPYVNPSPALGVTTAIIGNCGFTIAPCKSSDRELTMRNLTQVEGMSLDVLRQGVDWGFETFPQYLELIRRKGSAVNIAAYVGHSSVRTWVMGNDANKRAASPAEIELMADIVRDAMKSGAVGFASSTSPAHNGEGGFPMPSRLANDDEMMSLIKAMGEGGRGVYMVTKGGQMPVSFLEEMSSQSGRPVMIAALLHNSTNPDAVFKDLEAITQANARGRQLVGQVSCCPLTMDFTFLSPYPLEGLKAWQPALGLEHNLLVTQLKDANFRNAIRSELATKASFRLFNNEWDKVHVIETYLDEHQHFEQRTVSELATEHGKDPLDFILDLALSEDLKTVFTALLLNSDIPAVAMMLNHPHSLVSLSDAGAHLTFFNDAGFGLHLMGYWAREMGVMTLSEAVRRLTLQPAQILGLKNRGRISKGYFGDLLLFNPLTVNRGPKRRVFDLPGGAARLHTDAVGVRGVWVNGQRVADQNGVLKGAPLPGELLTNFEQ
jgi:N-acyl-D-aspartate/D-glutamate deacylase